MENLRRYLTYGGFVLADANDGSGGRGFDASFRRELARVLPGAPLEPVPSTHVLFKTFYLLDSAPGRLLLQPQLQAVKLGNRAAVMYSQNDLAGAWSATRAAPRTTRSPRAASPSASSRSASGVNLCMYALCLDYKDDAVHLPLILQEARDERRRPPRTWRLVSLSPLPAWALGLLTVLVLAGVALAVLGLRREPSKRGGVRSSRCGSSPGRWRCSSLLEPGLRQLRRSRVKNRVAVLVDRSASMGFPVRAEAEPGGGGGRGAGPLRPRARRAAGPLPGGGARLLARSWRRSRPRRSGRPARGSRTDLMAALRALKATDTGGSRKLAGAVLLSDGADNAELQSGLPPRQQASCARWACPVSTVRVGEPALKDLAVENVKVDDFAFVRNAVTVELELHARGFAGRDVPVVLQREGLTVGTRTVHVDQNDQRTQVSFTFTPDQTGRFVYTVGAPVFPGEAVVENNTRSFVLKVIRDRVRVLLVVGRPSWDERFLRGLLKQDPNVDLVSFYILRTSSDDTQTRNPERELSLIPFPMEEIFDTKLHTFDVVIFQNFGYAEPALSIASYERNLEQYVSGGGALLVIGGDHAFGEGRAAYPVLDRALPVDPSGTPAVVEPFKIKLTPEGLRHPVMRGADRRERDADARGTSSRRPAA